MATMHEQHQDQSHKQHQEKHLVTHALQVVLQDTYTLYLLTHNYHWNVEGAQFLSLHTFFEQQYNELFLAIDEIAERIRALGDYALPHGYGAILNAVSSFKSPFSDKGEMDSEEVSRHMVQNLIVLLEKTEKSAQEAKHLAENVKDDETLDLMVKRIAVHQKTNWMLKSTIK